MTGYGEGERESGRIRIRAEIRTVNHRTLNIQLRTPPGFDRYHPALERALKERFARGHVRLALSVAPESGDHATRVRVDVERARGYLEGLRRLKEALEVQGEVTLGLLAGFRDLYEVAEWAEAPEVDPEALEAVVGEAADRAVAMREEEGARLAGDLTGRLDAMETTVGAVEKRAPERLVAERDRLRARVGELLEGTGASVDEERIHREIAHLAERWDVHEEVVRFRSHLQMFRDTLAEGDPSGIGRRLGFIAQELLREANTMGSKANDAELAARVVALKEEIDRLREQLENVE